MWELGEGLHVNGRPSTTTPVSEVPAPHTPQRLEFLAKVCPWLRPVAWAPVVARMPLRSCFAVHLLGALAAFIACMVVVDLESTASGDSWSPWADFGLFWMDHPDIAAVVTGITAGFIELGFLAAAFVLTPWGAGDEPLRCSYAHALRHAWLLSTQAVPLILLIGLMIVLISAAARSFEARHPYPSFTFPTPPTYPAGAAPDSQAMKDYQAAQAEYTLQISSYNKRWLQTLREYESTRPFIVRNSAEIIGWTCIAGVVWVLWSLLRAIGAPRKLPSIVRPPTCEFCGYNLTGSALDGRCPECGTPAIDSLGPDVRPGTPLDRSTKEHWFAAWWKSSIEAMRRPCQFGRLIQINQPSRRYRWSLAVPLLVGILAASATFCASLWIQFRNSDEDFHLIVGKEFFTVAAPLAGISSAVSVVGATLLIAAIVGWILSWQNNRNLLPAAMQMQAHLGLLTILWLLFGCGWTILTFYVESMDVFLAMQRVLLIHNDPLEFFFWCMPVAAWLLLDVVLVWKGTVAARYANR